MTPEEMRDEAASIAATHPDIRDDNTPPVPAVIVTVPANVDGCQVAVRHMPYGIDVDYREKPSHGWAPIQFFGGSVEIRANSIEVLPCEEDTGRVDEVRNDATVTVLVDRGEVA